MFIRRALVLVLTILWLWPAGVFAQSEALKDAFREGQALYKAGQYEQAIPFYREALELGEREFGPDHTSTATLLSWLAITYNNDGRYADAEPLYKRSLAILEKTLGPEHPKVATNLNNLAKLYGDQGRYADAEPLYNRSLAISETRLTPPAVGPQYTLNRLRIPSAAMIRRASVNRPWIDKTI